MRAGGVRLESEAQPAFAKTDKTGLGMINFLLSVVFSSYKTISKIEFLQRILIAIWAFLWPNQNDRLCDEARAYFYQSKVQS